jgi:hypothetical protein
LYTQQQAARHVPQQAAGHVPLTNPNPKSQAQQALKQTLNPRHKQQCSRHSHCIPHQSKVAELEEGRACCGDERVGGLDVTVHHLVLVAAAQEGKTHTNLSFSAVIAAARRNRNHMSWYTTLRSSLHGREVWNYEEKM